MKTPTDGEVLLPCPLCAKKADLSDEDTLYPTGTYWRESYTGFRHYVSMDSAKAGDTPCWAMHCPVPSGGCGMSVSADSREEAIAKWNTRPAPQAGEAVARLKVYPGGRRELKARLESMKLPVGDHDLYAAPQGVRDAWVSVKDGLPEGYDKRPDRHGIPVLVIGKDKAMALAYYGTRIYKEPCFYLYGAPLNDVSHWAYPPAPPAMSEGGGE